MVDGSPLSKENETTERKGTLKEDETLQVLKNLGRDLQAIHHHVVLHLKRSPSSEEWIRIGLIIDRLLFILYILFILSTLLNLWLCRISHPADSCSMIRFQQMLSFISRLLLLAVFTCHGKLVCKEGQSGPTYESMQAVFDLQPFRPAVNLSNPTIANISFTLYAVLGVVSFSS
ncbi:hypothetical protein GOODEAATRI_021320 [Goodea atripinnis]|uniref:Uncharacterized protein n=1 Tax=Goodea atripinnis TaxID=208336 RepID=A0ABV0PZV9_9TELE